MRSAIIFIAILFAFSLRGSGQTRTVYGRVISEDLEVIPDVRIQTATTMLGTTDINGRFKFDLPQNTQTLLFRSLGMEQATIKLNSNCDTIEVILLNGVIYDYISLKKINRLRLKRFNTLPALYLQAYKKGLFTKGSVCYSREFEPYKPSQQR